MCDEPFFKKTPCRDGSVIVTGPCLHPHPDFVSIPAAESLRYLPWEKTMSLPPSQHSQHLGYHLTFEMAAKGHEKFVRQHKGKAPLLTRILTNWPTVETP